MAQAYKVAQAFQATVSKEDKTPKVVEFNGHTFNAWKVKLTGEEGKGWINVNKKPGNEIKPGDELYGDINEISGRFGVFYNFKSASRPFNESPVNQSTVADDNLMDDKLDYIISLLEALTDADAANVNRVMPGSQKVDLNDLDI